MSNQEDRLKTLIGHAKEYGFVFQSSEIYDGLSATYDYGPYGVELKNNIRRYWWEAMTKLNENIVGIDSAIFMHPTVWKASGHVDAFNDPLIDNKDSKKRYRADVLLEDHMAKYADKITKEIEKAKKKFGDAFDETQFRATNPNVKRSQDRIDAVEGRMKAVLEANDLEGVRQLIIDEEIKCPVSGTANWTEVRQFNLMFATELGSVSGESSTIYLRPETAQGIFVNFLNVQKSARMKMPFGIAQTGKAFRNEIVARQFIFRMREFEQMEMQFFMKPGTEMEWYEHVEREAHGMAQSVGHASGELPLPRPHQTGALRQRRLRHRVQVPHGLQGAGGHPQPHRFRPEATRGIQRQKAALLRYRDQRKLRALRGGNIDRLGPHVPRRAERRLRRREAGEW
jgi:glycyl-tRNA synthetase